MFDINMFDYLICTKEMSKMIFFIYTQTHTQHTFTIFHDLNSTETSKELNCCCSNNCCQRLENSHERACAPHAVAITTLISTPVYTTNHHIITKKEFNTKIYVQIIQIKP